MNKLFSKKIHGLFLLEVILLLFCQSSALAGEPVEATHKMQGNGGILQLTVPNPPPASIIVSLHLSAPVEIVSASPAVKKYDPNKNEAKWLLKDLSPGSHSISYELSGPFSPDQVNCVIQYKDPSSGRTINREVPLQTGR